MAPSSSFSFDVILKLRNVAGVTQVMRGGSVSISVAIEHIYSLVCGLMILVYPS